MVLPLLLGGAALVEAADATLPKHHDLTGKSSFIASADYEPLSGILVVTMQNGNRYEYPNIDQGTYDAFVDAASAGEFYNSSIKSGAGRSHPPAPPLGLLGAALRLGK
jgi:hypothetical protein